MKVLLLVPLWYPISRDAPGGIETFLARLIPELARLGCEITLVASGDSGAAGVLVPATARSLWDGIAAVAQRYRELYESLAVATC